MNPTILFILHLPPPVHGAAMMGKYIQESKIINEAFDCHYINLTTATSLQDIGKGGIKKLFRYLKLLVTIVRAVRMLKPQMVYITPNACGGAFYKDFIVVQLLKTMGCDIVAHYHNKGVSTRQNRWFDDKLYRLFFKKLKVILLAETLYDDVKKYVARKDVYICHNGIPEVADAEPIAKGNDVPHILFLSNMLIDKGVIILLDALKILKEKGCSFVADFVGGETKEINAATFEQEVKARGVNAIYHGSCYGEDKVRFLKESDIMAFPSLNECFPLVLLEAMQYGTPVVSTYQGGIPDIVIDGETGFLCPIKDAATFADRLETLLSDAALRTTMGKKGYIRFKEHFTLTHFEQHLKDILTPQNS
ncbi:MAG: glycosyltransferase family 4 protein [Prevotella sp.]|nr:glycosyltransferase family 4 protein [Prevotella sp.]